MLNKAPMMFWIQDLWPESLLASGVKSTLILNPIERLVRFTYKRCDRILAVSEGFFPSIVARGAESRHLRCWPQWAEAYYQPLKAQPELLQEKKVSLEDFKVIFAGNIGAAQSFETILAAAEKLKEYPEIKWVILGDGRMRPWVEERIEHTSLKNTVRLLGTRPPETMRRYFALADVLLVTLRKEPIFSLTVPGKVQSYLACARPIIASLDGEGARVVRDSGAGPVVPAEDADALAEAVLEMYRTPPEEREALGRRGREYFEANFEREKLLDQLEGWMHELAGERA
jgi:glycosyltransferase involved in cell wall biosynthesis